MATPTLPSATWLTELMASQRALFQSISWPPVYGPWQPVANVFADWHRHGMQQMAALWPGGQMGGVASETAPDKRFVSSAWQKDLRFDLMSRAYLQQARAMNAALDAAPIDERLKGQWSFVLRQVLDAASPANCLLTNPDAMQTALESGGASLAEGTRLFLEDFAKGKVSMTDDSAFEIGVDLATTPGSVVYENELMQLLQYAPTTAKVYRRPLVIVPPCINKYYILDLQPDNSFVAHAVAQGHTVFLVSWRNVGPEQQHLGWDDYLEQGVMQAIDTARSITRADQVNTLGFCIGGVLLAGALGVMAATGEDTVASATLLTTMLDYTETGELGLLVSEQSVAQRETAIGEGGLLKGRELAQIFAALRANDLIWPYVVNGYLKGQAPPPFDLLFWNGDDTNLPGPMYCWYLRNTYLENRFVQPGATLQCGQPFDLSRIEVPAFVYASREDHIVPWQTAYASSHLLGGDTRFVLGASGHIAGVINPPAKNKRSFWIGQGEAEAPADASGWLEAADEQPGSWWPMWAEWLAEHAGPQVAAPKKPGNAHHSVIEPAPGRYVKAKAP